MLEVILPVLLGGAFGGFAVSACVTWFYHTELLAEVLNLLPRLRRKNRRPRFYLRKDVLQWLPSTRVPTLLQQLLECPTCGTAHFAFWLGLPHATWIWDGAHPYRSSAMLLLFWAGSAGVSLWLHRPKPAGRGPSLVLKQGK